MKQKKSRPILPFRKKVITLPLSAALGVFLLSGSIHAEGITLLEPVKNVDVNWLSSSSQISDPLQSAIAVIGNRISLDLSSHTNWKGAEATLTTATSNQEAVVAASLEQNTLQLDVKGYGTASITLRAEDQDGQTFVDTLRLEIAKIGDTTGDGMVTSADALAIMKAANNKTTLTPEQLNVLDINRDGQVTTADATLLLSQYVGKTTAAAASTYIVTIKSVNDAPKAYHVKPAVITPLNGQLTAAADYSYLDAESDAEGSTIIQWYKGLQQDGSDKELIPGAVGTTYSIQSSDEGAYLFYTVTPVAVQGTLQGQPAWSEASVQLPDQTSPSVLNVSVPDAGSYGAGQALEFTVTMSEAIVVSSNGSPSLQLTIGGQAREALIDAGRSSGNKLVFVYTLSNPDTDTDGIQLGQIQLPQGVTIRDNSGNDSDLTFSAPSTSGVLVDTASPYATLIEVPIDAVYRAGDVLRVKLEWSEPIQLSGGVPAVEAKIGSEIRTMNYVAEESLNGEMVFTYTIQDGDEDLDGVTFEGLKLQGSSVKDHAGNAAILFLEMNYSNGIQVDARGPVIDNVSLPQNGSYKAGDILTFTLNMSEPYVLQGTPSLGMIVDGEARTAAFDSLASTSTSLVFTYTVDADENDTDGIEIGAVQVDGVDISDALGNKGSLNLPAQNTSGIFIDNLLPELSGLSPENGALASSTSGDLTLTFNEPIKSGAGKKITIMDTADQSPFELLSDDSVNVTILGNTVTIKNPGFRDNGSYIVDIEAGAFTDLAGNAFGGLTGSSDWSFETPDHTSPTITSTTPVNEGIGAGLSDPFTIKFSEAVQVKNPDKKITLRKASDDSEVFAYTAGDAVNASLSGDTLTIVNQGLEEKTDYYIEIESGAFEDAAGNEFAGLSGQEAWSFSTSTPATLTAMNMDPEFSEKQMRYDPYAMGALMMLSLEGGEFKDSISAVDFQLNNAPAGLTIMRAEYMTGDSVMLALDYDGTDFDQDILDFSITAKASALVDGQEDLTSPVMAITADVEQTYPVFISEYLYGGGEKVVLEIYNAGSVQDAGFTIDVYTTDREAPYVVPVRTDSITEPNFDIPVNPNNFIIGINKVYYGYQEDNGGLFYHLEMNIPYVPVIKAIVLKKGDTVIDVLGSPTSNRAILLEPTTMRRKAGINSGSPAYIQSQWNYYTPAQLGDSFFLGIWQR